VTSGSWTTATLSVPRYFLAAASSGTFVFFAGGGNTSSTGYVQGPTTPYNQVDIYNVSNGSWSTATLSQARCFLAATSVGNVVLFGGGSNGNVFFNVVDIYDVSSDMWTTATLSQAREGLAATSVANRYALFAGGYNGTGPSNVVDLFDSLCGMWNSTTLSLARRSPEAASLGNLAFLGGGDYNAYQTFNIVDIFNATTQTWSTATLSQNRTVLAAASIGDIVAFGGGTPDGFAVSAVVDMYNATSNIWFTANLSQSRCCLAATSSTNKIFFGGGVVSNNGVSNVVDIFDIPLPLPTPPPLTPTPVSCPTPPLSLLIASSVSSTATSRVLSSVNSALVGGLIGGVVGTLLVVSGIVVLVILLRKKRKQKKSTQTVYEDDKTKPIEFDEKDATLESRRQTVTLESDTTTMSTYTQTVTETLKSLTPGQIPLNELEIGREIGNGNYGRVCVGKWKKYRVALKFCQNRGKMDEFMREANLMISLPPHPNVVRMYGVSIDGTQPVIVMEYCAGGSLDKMLFDTEEHISDEQKIRWVHEIALGMCHLHKHNIVHRDLAARNILLSLPNLANAQPKIADFGMSRVLEQTANEGNTLNNIGPIRWMSPESLARQIYSKKSDMWMFGMLVYEIAVRREPFADNDPLNISTRIRDEGLTPTIPKECPVVLRKVMQMCWKKDPEQRPTMEVVLAFLERGMSKPEAT
jgi:predicted Ser/Thr protein kinase